MSAENHGPDLAEAYMHAAAATAMLTWVFREVSRGQFEAAKWAQQSAERGAEWAIDALPGGDVQRAFRTIDDFFRGLGAVWAGNFETARDYFGDAEWHGGYL